MSATLITVTMNATPASTPVEMQVGVIKPAAGRDLQLTLNAVNGSVTLTLNRADAANIANQLASTP